MLELFASSPGLFIAMAFLFSLLIGSFLNVVIYRLPIMMQREWHEEARKIVDESVEGLPEGEFNLSVPRSRCPSCGQKITALQNIPVISWLVLRGKCANCSNPISARYPAIELLTAILTAVTAWRFGFGYEAAAAILLTWVLIAISFVDLDHQLIPDSMSVPLIWIGLFLSLFHPLANAEILFVEPKTAIIGAVAGYLVLWSVNAAFRLVRGMDGMGYGDFKLLAALGAWLGWLSLPLIIFMSAVVAAIVGLGMIVFLKHDKRIPIPYGPYLATAGWITMLWGSEISTAYLRLSSVLTFG